METGITPRKVCASGGGAYSSLWRGIQADIFAREVVTVQSGEDAAAVGAAIVAGVGTTIWPSVDEAASLLQIETRTKPSAERVEVYSR